MNGPKIMVEIKKWIVSEFKRRGFKKNGRVFVKRANESTICISTHKSRFSQDHFIDCGVILDGFIPQDDQYEPYWTVSARIEHIYGESEKARLVRQALDGENLMDDEERKRIIADAMDVMELRMDREISKSEWLTSHAYLRNVGGFWFNERLVKECINSRENMS